MCGGALAPSPSEPSDLVCKSCGSIYSVEDQAPDRIVGQPTWGAIDLDLSSSLTNLATVFATIRSYWLMLENSSAQRLFPGQLEAADAEPELKLRLFGPETSFLRLKRHLSEQGLGGVSITFSPMDTQQILDMRDRNRN